MGDEVPAWDLGCGIVGEASAGKATTWKRGLAGRTNDVVTSPWENTAPTKDSVLGAGGGCTARLRWRKNLRSAGAPGSKHRPCDKPSLPLQLGLENTSLQQALVKSCLPTSKKETSLWESVMTGNRETEGKQSHMAGLSGRTQKEHQCAVGPGSGAGGAGGAAHS